MTKIAADEWSFYFPDDAETKDDAIPIIGRILNADDAACEACKYDFSDRDGWERQDTRFSIAVISPSGETKLFWAWHKPSVEHRVRQK